MQGETVTAKQTAAKRKRRRRSTAPAAMSGTAEDEAGHGVAALTALGPQAGEFVLRLVIVNRLHMWEDCPHEACRRARACRDDDMACFEERRGELKRKVIEEAVIMLCTAGVSSDEFYDYLDEVADDAEESGGPEAW